MEVMAEFRTNIIIFLKAFPVNNKPALAFVPTHILFFYP
jgi:hypothetical protein